MPATCTAGVCGTTSSPQGLPCSQNGGTICDGNGTCVQCITANQCPGTDTDCQHRTCNASTCGTVNEPAGTQTPTQTTGDCQILECDGAGDVTSIADNSDVPADDGNQCTAEICASGVPIEQNRPAGFPCNQNGGTVCNGSGACV
jgi:hypothetical protein